MARHSTGRCSGRGQRRHGDLQQTTVLRIHPRITAVDGAARPVEDADLDEPRFQLTIEPDPNLFGRGGQGRAHSRLGPLREGMPGRRCHAEDHHGSREEPTRSTAGPHRPAYGNSGRNTAG
jgi:hypothetical protein